MRERFFHASLPVPSCWLALFVVRWLVEASTPSGVLPVFVGVSSNAPPTFSILGPHPWHMEVSRLGVDSELQPPAYTTVRATQDLSHVFDLHHSSWTRWIPQPTEQGQELNPHPHGY